MPLLKDVQQQEISEQRRLPVDDGISYGVQTITGETVQLYYYNNGVLTVDAGQATGSIVVGKLANCNIKNTLGDVVGTYNDTSLSFTSTALTTKVAFPYKIAELHDADSGTNKATAIVSGFANGEYCIDHRTGTIYGKKASTQTQLSSASYKVKSSSSSGSGTEPNINIAEIGGTAISDTNPIPSEIVATSDATGFSTLLDTDGDNTAQVVKASSGNLYHIEIYNSNVADAFVQLFDAAVGDVTVGTTTPKFVLYVPGQGGSVRDYNIPMSFATAITYACTTTATGSGDPTAGLTIAFGYK